MSPRRAGRRPQGCNVPKSDMVVQPTGPDATCILAGPIYLALQSYLGARPWPARKSSSRPSPTKGQVILPKAIRRAAGMGGGDTAPGRGDAGGRAVEAGAGLRPTTTTGGRLRVVAMDRRAEDHRGDGGRRAGRSQASPCSRLIPTSSSGISPVIIRTSPPRPCPDRRTACLRRRHGHSGDRNGCCAASMAIVRRISPAPLKGLCRAAHGDGGRAKRSLRWRSISPSRGWTSPTPCISVRPSIAKALRHVRRPARQGGCDRRSRDRATGR